MEAFRNHEGRVIRLTDERLEHILRRSEMMGQDAKLAETLTSPDLVVESRKDPSVRLYHELYEQSPVTRKYLLVAVKVGPDDGFVITAFFTDRQKQGAAIWPI